MQSFFDFLEKKSNYTGVYLLNDRLVPGGDFSIVSGNPNTLDRKKLTVLMDNL